jgi:hypothetical protein
MRLALLLLATLAIQTVFPIPATLAKPVTTAHVAGQATGFLPAPCNCAVVVFIAASATGSRESLDGSGVNHATTGSTNHFSLAGSTDGTTVALSGVIEKSTSPFLVGSTVSLEGDVDTGAVTLTLVPHGGPFVGQTLVFNGSGTVVVTKD